MIPGAEILYGSGADAVWCIPPEVETRVGKVRRRSRLRPQLRSSRRQRELRSAPHVRYWPAVSVRHGDFRPVHVDGRLCWLWVPRPTSARPEPSADAMSPAHFLEHETARHL